MLNISVYWSSKHITGPQSAVEVAYHEGNLEICMAASSNQATSIWEAIKPHTKPSSHFYMGVIRVCCWPDIEFQVSA